MQCILIMIFTPYFSQLFHPHPKQTGKQKHKNSNQGDKNKQNYETHTITKKSEIIIHKQKTSHLSSSSPVATLMLPEGLVFIILGLK